MALTPSASVVLAPFTTCPSTKGHALGTIHRCSYYSSSVPGVHRLQRDTKPCHSNLMLRQRATACTVVRGADICGAPFVRDLNLCQSHLLIILTIMFTYTTVLYSSVFVDGKIFFKNDVLSDVPPGNYLKKKTELTRSPFGTT